MLILGDPEYRPKFPLTDLEALELVYGPPEKILDYSDFRPYQKWMSKLIMRKDILLGAEMGLGKTAAVLKAIQVMLDEGFITNVLIVAPLRVSENTWPEEIAKWTFSRHLTYRIVTGTEKQRRAALDQPAQITIINRENVRWLREFTGTRKWVYDMLVYDEASRLKSGRKRTNPQPRADGSMPAKKLTELGSLRRVRFKFKRIVELSGTPAPNGLIDLWGPIYLLDQGRRLGSSITAYKKRWFRPADNGYGVEPLPSAEASIMREIKDIFYSLREEDYLKLPPLIPVDHRVKLKPRDMDLYKEFQREMAIEVRDNEGNPQMLEAINNGVLTNKLLQFANGSLYLEDKEVKKIHDLKLDVLDSIIQEAEGRPILCAYSFQFDKAAIKKRFPFVRIYGESKNDNRDWNAGRIKLLLTHPASAGHGLNFQHGSNIAVWYGLTWSLELYLQFRKRLHRSGQKEDKVFLHRIITEGTVDERVLRVLETRGATQDDITNEVRVLLQQAAA
jgi:SNF2 family DNA or RNA helicase